MGIQKEAEAEIQQRPLNKNSSSILAWKIVVPMFTGVVLAVVAFTVIKAGYNSDLKIELPGGMVIHWNLDPAAPPSR